MRKRYLRSQEVQRTLHSEIVNLFFSEFNTNESDDENNAENKSKLITAVNNVVIRAKNNKKYQRNSIYKNFKTAMVLIKK